MSDWSRDINLETIKEYLQECAENDDYHYEQYQIDIILHEYIRQKQIIEELQNQLQQKENKEKEIREYIENNWISQKDADNYRFDHEELNIEISDIAVLFDILEKEVN